MPPQGMPPSGMPPQGMPPKVSHYGNKSPTHENYNNPPPETNNN